MIWDCGEVQGAPSHRHRLLAALQERSAQGWMHGRWRLVLLLSVVPTLWARLRTVIELGGERLPRQQGGVDFFFEFLIRRPQAHGHRRTQPHTPPSPPSPSHPSSRLLTSARRPRLRRPRLPPSSLRRAAFAAIAAIAASTLAADATVAFAMRTAEPTTFAASSCRVT
jgi:hypothetical protein